MFEIAVGDGSRRVSRRHKSYLHCVRERVAPDIGLPAWVEVHSSHTRFGRVCRSQESGFLGDDFR